MVLGIVQEQIRVLVPVRVLQLVLAVVWLQLWFHGSLDMPWYKIIFSRIETKPQDLNPETEAYYWYLVSMGPTTVLKVVLLSRRLL